MNIYTVASTLTTMMIGFGLISIISGNILTLFEFGGISFLRVVIIQTKIDLIKMNRKERGDK